MRPVTSGGVMQRRTRLAWLVSGGLLTLVTVVAFPLAAWIQLDSAETAYPNFVLHEEGSETTTTVYTTTAPELVVRSSADAQVTVVKGTPGRVTVKREITWSRTRPDLGESWNGGTLELDVQCPPGAASAGCGAAYTITVPDIPVIRVPL
ncbi:hypothetical protein SAMN05421505_106216 [Sinosporangium album]|uniref:Uncharacterized protein n=1 Tax=Sinosporangium album TaxID=504805 RepID=A0A1G7W8P4_9ACTN|nr:hypothetical protein [Sinosporangium album]SDG67470.1 hypothetical protein SAMN05421505_106216 [Sinosporangium album]